MGTALHFENDPLSQILNPCPRQTPFRSVSHLIVDGAMPSSTLPLQLLSLPSQISVRCGLTVASVSSQSPPVSIDTPVALQLRAGSASWSESLARNKHRPSVQVASAHPSGVVVGSWARHSSSAA